MFKLEKEMNKPVESWLRSQNLQFKQEVTTPWGICDFIAVEPNRNHVRERIQRRQRSTIGSLIKVMIYNSIPDADNGISKTLKTIYKEFKEIYSEEEFQSILINLKKNHFIQENRKNHYQSLNGWFPLHKRLITIELKLNRVEEVFFQAKNHSVIASENYVGLPYITAQRLINSKRVEKFKDFGIGILGITDFDCSVLLAPQNKVDQQKNLQMHIVEKFWSNFYKQFNMYC